MVAKFGRWYKVAKFGNRSGDAISKYSVPNMFARRCEILPEFAGRGEILAMREPALAFSLWFER